MGHNQSQPQFDDNQTQGNQSDSDVSNEIEIDVSGDLSFIAMARNILIIIVIIGLIFLLRPNKNDIG